MSDPPDAGRPVARPGDSSGDAGREGAPSPPPPAPAPSQPAAGGDADGPPVQGEGAPDSH
jgi:hypothetical protein